MKRSETRSRWRKLIEEQRGSGLSIAEFCRRQDVCQASFFGWRKKLRESSPEIEAFVPLSVIGGGGVEVELPGGAVVRLPSGDERSLKQVMLLLMAGGESEE
jgi:hypothetical protein